MPDSISLSYWPAALDNVKWSKDELIGVGGRDTVTILTPLFKRFGLSLDHWTQVSLATAVFTEEQAPLLDPQPWSIFSMAEELSDRLTTAIAWSPLGIAKHRKSALAVLTSNHVLSIWECQGQSDFRDDWKRVLILNIVLQRYFADTSNHQRVKSTMDPLEQQARQSRIRSFAWGFPLRSGSIMNNAYSWGHQFLALANECGDVLLLQVTSPYDLLASHQSDWQASVLHCFRAAPLHSKESPLQSCLPSRLRSKPAFIDQLAWGPWIDDDYGGQRSTIAFVCHSILYHTTVRSYRTPTGVRLDSAIPEILPVNDQPVLVTGPLQWSQTVDDSTGNLYLVVFTSSAVLCVSFDSIRTTNIKITRHTIENAFDEISGVTFGKNEQGTLTVSYTVHFNATRIENATLCLPLGQNVPASSPSWQRDLEDTQALHSAAHDLAGSVFTKTYGIASSPLGDLVATCSSLHPRDALEYTIVAEQACSLTIARERDASAQNIYPPSGGSLDLRDVSSETLFLSVRRFLDNNPETEIDIEAICNQMLKITGVEKSSNGLKPHDAQSIDAHMSVAYLRQHILYDADIISRRYKRIINMAKDDVSRVAIPDLVTVRRLITEVLKLHQTLCDDGDFGKVIIHTYSVVLAILDEREGKRTNRTDMLDDSHAERCAICGVALPFESLRWARCTNGHQFQRCSLTFLAIQSPGKAKSCTICNAQCLSEYLIEPLRHEGYTEAVIQERSMPETTKQGAGQIEPAASLARVLFAACDICVLCGGKFTG